MNSLEIAGLNSFALRNKAALDVFGFDLKRLQGRDYCFKEDASLELLLLAEVNEVHRMHHRYLGVGDRPLIRSPKTGDIVNRPRDSLECGLKELAFPSLESRRKALEINVTVGRNL